MRTVRTKVYLFNELSKEAQQTAVKNFLATNYENIELYSFVEDCKEYAAEKGFKNAKIQYSLSYSQGDGLSFSADLDIETLIREAKPDIKQSVLNVILDYCVADFEGNTGHYCYARPDDVSFYLDTNSYKCYDRLTSYVSDIKVYMQDKYMEVCGTLEANGYSELEYQDSEEYAIEVIIDNDYEFTKDGKQF